MFRVGVSVLHNYYHNAGEKIIKDLEFSVINYKSRLFSSQKEEDAHKTCLYDFHVKHRGKIVNFAGWLLPLQYAETISASHQHTRRFASLFDVGHMLQTQVSGRDATEFIEALTTSDLKTLRSGCSTLAIFTNENGGIVDDLIITKIEKNKYFLVSNAGRRNEDSQLLLRKKEELSVKGQDIQIEFLDPLEQQGIIALQGPSSENILQSLTEEVDLKKLKFMMSIEAKLMNEKMRITRCGYTGEDGFEISVPVKSAGSLAEKILENPDVKLAGLGVRDSLRLEAGLCLYGQDIDEDTTPVEANLSWLIAKRRREEANFPGSATILSQIKSGVVKKRVGLAMMMGGQGPAAREGAVILTTEGERVGKVTSGGPSPTLGRPIAMGYVPQYLAKNGNSVLVEVRGKTYEAILTKMPFIKTNYYT